MKRWAAVALVAASGCTPSPIATTAPAADDARIAVEVRSWGRLRSEWTIAPDGTGRQTRPEPGVFDAKRFVTRRFDAGREGYARIEALLAPAKPHAGAKLPCDPRISDLPYGTIRWMGEETRELSFDIGCRGDVAEQAIGGVPKADSLVAEWASAGEIVATREAEAQ